MFEEVLSSIKEVQNEEGTHHGVKEA